MREPPDQGAREAHRAGVAVGLWTALLLLVCPSLGGAAGGPAVEGTVTILDREGKPKSHH